MSANYAMFWKGPVCYFLDAKIEQADVKNNLLRIKVPDPVEEQEALWAASADLAPVNELA